MQEGILFFLIGLLGLVDTVTPQRLAQAKGYGDVIGTVLYVGFLSAWLATAGVVWCLKNRAALGKLRPLFSGEIHLPSARQGVTNLLRNKVAIAFFAVGLYTLITPSLGYALATFLFFFGVFGWQGYRWSIRNLVLSIITAGAFFAFTRITDIPVPTLFESW